jgi:hypothetical protein
MSSLEENLFYPKCSFCGAFPKHWYLTESTGHQTVTIDSNEFYNEEKLSSHVYVTRYISDENLLDYIKFLDNTITGIRCESCGHFYKKDKKADISIISDAILFAKNCYKLEGITRE